MQAHTGAPKAGKNSYHTGRVLVGWKGGLKLEQTLKSIHTCVSKGYCVVKGNWKVVPTSRGWTLNTDKQRYNLRQLVSSAGFLATYDTYAASVAAILEYMNTHARTHAMN